MNFELLSKLMPINGAIYVLGHPSELISCTFMRCILESKDESGAHFRVNLVYMMSGNHPTIAVQTFFLKEIPPITKNVNKCFVVIADYKFKSTFTSSC